MSGTIDGTIDKRLANLRPQSWKPGQSGNPLGRPKREFSLTQGMRDFLSEKDPDKKKQRKDILIEKTFQMAQKGDIAAIKLLWNYIDGMPKGSETNVAVQVNNYTQQDFEEGFKIFYKNNRQRAKELIDEIEQ